MKTFSRVITVIFLLIISRQPCASQSKWLVENYKYWGQTNVNTVMPVIHFNTERNWCGELRYNYEEVNTFSVFGGRTIEGGGAVSYSFSPMVGYSFGRFTGPSAGLNTDIEWKKLYFTSQVQYSISSRTNADNFFFTWSELGCGISNFFFIGVTAQFTRQVSAGSLEPGLLAGLSFGNLSLPFYVFNPFGDSRYFAAGINYEFSLKKKNRTGSK